MPRKLPKLRHIKHTRAHGRDYWYFDTGKTKPNGQPLRTALPDPASPQFGGAYAAALAARTKRANVAYTVADLARDYERSAWFAGKAENTQKYYRSALAKITHFWGSVPVNALTPAHVRKVIDSAIWEAATINAVTATLGAMYKWGRTNGEKASVEPTKDIERMKGGEHDPWPEDVLVAGLDAEDDLIRLAVHVMYFTGLRIGDALSLRWGQIKDGVITVIPQKTSRAKSGPKVLHIPLAADLKAELDRTPRKSLTILPAMTQARLRKDLQAFTLSLGIATVPHGLRKNAVNSLLLAGCSIPETAAITGQTYQVVEHYAAQINRRKLAGAAIVKLDISRKGNV